MDPETHDFYDARARILKALGHPTRLLLVKHLAEREHTVRELTALAGVDISTVSKHLAQLRGAGLVQHEKWGTTMYYRLRVASVCALLEGLEAVLRDAADEQTRLARGEQAPPAPPQ